MNNTIDSPLTQQDEDNFYGVPATEYEWLQATHAAERGYDADDLQTAASEHAAEILAALIEGDYAYAGGILAGARRLTIKRRAEFSVTGRIK